MLSLVPKTLLRENILHFLYSAVTAANFRFQYFPSNTTAYNNNEHIKTKQASIKIYFIKKEIFDKIFWQKHKPQAYCEYQHPTVMQIDRPNYFVS